MTDRLKLLSALVSADDPTASPGLSIFDVAALLEQVRDEHRSALVTGAR